MVNNLSSIITQLDFIAFTLLKFAYLTFMLYLRWSRSKIRLINVTYWGGRKIPSIILNELSLLMSVTLPQNHK